MEDGKSMKISRKWFIQAKKDNIESVYSFKPEKDMLGSGTYGAVFVATHKVTKDPRAIKAIAKSKVKNPETFKNEIEIMKKLVNAYYHHNNPRTILILLSSMRFMRTLCRGGELFERISNKGHFTEKEAMDLFSQIIHALYYCHSFNICHRDLKPENFLYLTDAEDSPIKVIDFGLSKIAQADSEMSTRAGTPYYISPEVLDGKYNQSCDIWSAGVILYILLCGYPPFYGNSDREILEAVKTGFFNFEGEEWESVTDDAKDLISKMLTKPDKRLTASQVLEHQWFKTEKKSNNKININVQHLKNFIASSKLQKVVLTCMASQLSESEIMDLGKIFLQLDKNGDGTLTLEELTEELSKLPDFNTKDIQELMNSMDTDKSGKIDYTEFLAATMEKTVYLREEKLYMAFKMFDKDDDGKITANELKEVLGSQDMYVDKDSKFWDDLVKEVDLNGDGVIDYNEFLIMMNKGLGVDK